MPKAGSKLPRLVVLQPSLDLPGDPPHCPPQIHGSHIPRWWMSNGWDAGRTSPSLPGAPNVAPGVGCLAVPHGAQGGGQVPSRWWPLVAPVQWHSFSPAVPPVPHLQTLPGKYQYL